MSPHQVDDYTPTSALPLQAKHVLQSKVEDIPGTDGFSSSNTNGISNPVTNGIHGYNINGILLQPFEIKDHPIDENSSLKVDMPTSTDGYIVLTIPRSLS
jgi:hypothetical protein